MMWGSDFATGPHGGWRAITLREKVAREHAVLEPVNRFAVAFGVRVVHRGKQVRRPTPSRTIRFSDHVDVRYEHAPVAFDRFARNIWCIVSERNPVIDLQPVSRRITLSVVISDEPIRKREELDVAPNRATALDVVGCWLVESGRRLRGGSRN